MATSSSPAAKKKVLWDRNGVNGGPSSMKILLDWLTTEGNFTKWKGGDRASGVTDDTSIRSGLVKRCPYYYELSPAMNDRQSTRPSQTTDDLDEITKSKGKNKWPISIAESTSNKRQQGDSLSALTRLREKSQHARDQANAKLLELEEKRLQLEEKRLQLEEKRESREENQAKAQLELISAQTRSVEIGNTTQLLLQKKCI
ncbi:hypothetical protein F443_09403 [Phytophthora nicotianae P1569]|uniref:Uncharacterized protein n=1 Tax=Phytophthora nicotianae P1569 TaxID=1317065 RepID=V9F3S8_PHYNI|nr:hypothetical protein F443_09403 [Phytophthora nicotianae P1569]